MDQGEFPRHSIAPKAKGTAEVNSRLGHMEIKLNVKGLPAATSFGPEFLTYVLWAITPDGHSANLGEVVLGSDGNFKGNITTGLQSFGLIITAEPYFAVRQPSDVVVMENVVRDDTKGKVEYVNAKYELLQRGEYTYQVPASQVHPIVLDSNKKSPLELYQAQNAIQIARYAKADQYGGDTFQDAVKLLNQAQDYAVRKQWKPSIMTAKEAVQKAEDARIICAGVNGSLRSIKNDKRPPHARPRPSNKPTKKLVKGRPPSSRHNRKPNKEQLLSEPKPKRMLPAPNLLSRRRRRSRLPLKQTVCVSRLKPIKTPCASNCCSNSMPFCRLAKPHGAWS